MERRFRVETQDHNGVWWPFTKEPIYGETTAKEHLVMAQKEAKEWGHSPEKLRLHEYTEEETKLELVKKYREKFHWYLMSLPLETLAEIAEE
jgi:5,10-methylene-tetrahydrofolate dehydrogenase/methenyl tetrahydrofolate cyclohydrolase